MTRCWLGAVTPAQAGVHAVQTLQCDIDRTLDGGSLAKILNDEAFIYLPIVTRGP